MQEPAALGATRGGGALQMGLLRGVRCSLHLPGSKEQIQMGLLPLGPLEHMYFQWSGGWEVPELQGAPTSVLIFAMVSFVSFALISALIFKISFLLLTLGFFISSFSSCFS